ncbi:MAG: hypothetical protein WD154_07700 [Nitrosopumilaceae archaeon]
MSELDSLKKLVQNHEKRILKLEKPLNSPSKIKKINLAKSSIMDLILEVKEEGFFDKPKFHGDIVAKFEEMGHIYSGKSIDNPLSRALKARILGRKKIDGKWGYVKR